MKGRKRKHSDLIQLVITLSILFIFSAGIVMTVQSKISKIIEENYIDDISNTSSELTIRVNKFGNTDIQRYDNLCLSLSSIKNFTSETLQEVLLQNNIAQVYRHIEILLPDNTVISEGQRYLPLTTDYEDVYKYGNHFEGPLCSATTNSDIMVHYMPYIRNSEIQAFIAISLDCDYLSKQIVISEYENNLQSAMINVQSNSVLACSASDYPFTKTVFEQFDENTKYQRITDKAYNKKYLVFIQKTNMPNICVVTYMEEAVIIQNLKQYRRIAKNAIYFEFILFTIAFLLHILTQKKQVRRVITNENSKKNEIIDILSGGFTGLYFCNLETNECEVVSISDRIKSDTGVLIKEYSDLQVVLSKFVNTVVHPEDRKIIADSLDFENIKVRLIGQKSYTEVFRRKYDDQYLYTRLTVAKAGNPEDKPVCIAIGFSEIDDEFRKEQSRQIEITQTLEIAYQDGLTGIKNKYAYRQAEEILDIKLTGTNVSPFAIAVFDVNNLKQMNDNYGHEQGDKLICDAAKRICDSFKHSPVYRVGGDEFAVILTGVDYDNRNNIIQDFRDEMVQRVRKNERVIIASGISDFIETDVSCSVVFNRADEEMYRNKASLKQDTILH